VRADSGQSGGPTPRNSLRDKSYGFNRNFLLAILDGNDFMHYLERVVNRLKPIVAVLMLTLFAFASSHPLLACLGLIHQEVTSAERPAGSDSNHEVADGKCPPNFSRDEIQKSFADGSFNLAEILALACVLLQHEDLSALSSVEIASSPPPELGTTWQFSSRAALPARAPSFVS
jgi:hypothetical protein